MIKRLLPFIASLMLSAFLVTGGFWLGFREGTNVGAMLDTIYRADNTQINLTKLRRGPTENMIIGFETEIDLALMYANQLEQHPLRALLEPFWGLPVSQSQPALVRIASYRGANPSPVSSKVLAATPVPSDPAAAAAHKEVLAAGEQNDRVIASMVAKYAVKASAPQ